MTLPSLCPLSLLLFTGKGHGPVAMHTGSDVKGSDTALPCGNCDKFRNVSVSSTTHTAGITQRASNNGQTFAFCLSSLISNLCLAHLFGETAAPPLPPLPLIKQRNNTVLCRNSVTWHQVKGAEPSVLLRPPTPYRYLSTTRCLSREIRLWLPVSQYKGMCQFIPTELF
jgi:hypothetical protein